VIEMDEYGKEGVIYQVLVYTKEGKVVEVHKNIDNNDKFYFGMGQAIMQNGRVMNVKFMIRGVDQGLDQAFTFLEEQAEAGIHEEVEKKMRVAMEELKKKAGEGGLSVPDKRIILPGQPGYQGV
jgi:hypothetical protein